MHNFDEPPPRKRRIAIWLWLLLAFVLLGPSLLVGIVRGAALGFSCAPGPALCHGMALGTYFRDALDAAWLIGTDTFATPLIALASAIAALFARRPLLAGFSMFVFPLAALLLPIAAVTYSTYPGCAPNDSGIGDCTLWGAKMGMSFHHAATAPWLVYGLAPYCVALALMIGVIGFLFCRK